MDENEEEENGDLKEGATRRSYRRSWKGKGGAPRECEKVE